MIPGKRFYTRTRPWSRYPLAIHVCDYPSYTGVFTLDDSMIRWRDILPVMKWRWRSASSHFRERLHRFRQEQRHDCIARFLTMRDWSRTSLCNYCLQTVVDSQEVLFTKFLPRRFSKRGGYKVIWDFTREQHYAYDPLWVDTVLYLPIGTSVWPAKDRAPKGVDACKWLWVQYRLAHSLHEEAGWLHPDIITWHN